MKKILLSIIAALAFTLPAAAQSIIEDFESNSLEWTECTIKDAPGHTIISNGELILSSLKHEGSWNYDFHRAYCYAPLNNLNAFSIIANVSIRELDNQKYVGFIVNYRDDGNFYLFKITAWGVDFIRYENGKNVGDNWQRVAWSEKKNVKQKWELRCDGETLSFFVNDMMIVKLKYMPIIYSGVGFYTDGEQKLVVEDIEFIQN